MPFTGIYMKLKAEKSYKRLTFSKKFARIHRNKGVISANRRSITNILGE